MAVIPITQGAKRTQNQPSEEMLLMALAHMKDIGRIPQKDQGESYDPEDPSEFKKLPEDWSSVYMTKDSSGVQKAVTNPEKVEGNPKYPQSLETPKGQASKEVVQDRIDRLVTTFSKVYGGKKVSTDEMVDAINGFLDHVQGIQALKGMLGRSQGARPAARDSTYMLPPGET